MKKEQEATIKKPTPREYSPAELFRMDMMARCLELAANKGPMNDARVRELSSYYYNHVLEASGKEHFQCSLAKKVVR